MNSLARPLPSSPTPSGSASPTALTIILLTIAHLAMAQDPRYPSERANLGFRGPVQSVLTTVMQLHPDPRPVGQRKLFARGITPNWAYFDAQGRRTEFASISSASSIEAISTCTFSANGTKTCVDSAGKSQQSRERETTLPDGSIERTYFLGSKVQSREVTLVDESGGAVGSRNFDSEGKLTSEELKLPNGDDESKIYGPSGETVFDEVTRISDDKTRFDRWSYDRQARLTWNIALNENGDLLSDWYRVGYRPKVSSSDSLGICRPRLCVDYKFDEQGSGRLEKTVQHTPGQGNLEPDSEEHYNFDGALDERIEFHCVRDSYNNWTSRSIFIWDSATNQMVEVERDTRTIQYY
jgi:hypothetical protein